MYVIDHNSICDEFTDPLTVKLQRVNEHFGNTRRMENLPASESAERQKVRGIILMKARWLPRDFLWHGPPKVCGCVWSSENPMIPPFCPIRRSGASFCPIRRSGASFCPIRRSDCTPLLWRSDTSFLSDQGIDRLFLSDLEIGHIFLSDPEIDRLFLSDQEIGLYTSPLEIGLPRTARSPIRPADASFCPIRRWAASLVRSGDRTYLSLASFSIVDIPVSPICTEIL